MWLMKRLGIPTKVMPYSRRAWDQKGVEVFGRPLYAAPQDNPILLSTDRTYGPGLGIRGVGLRIFDSLDTCVEREKKSETREIFNKVRRTTKYVFTCSTVMLSFLTSSARASVNLDKKAFVPEYVASIGEATDPAKDPMFRMSPRLLKKNHVNTNKLNTMNTD